MQDYRGNHELPVWNVVQTGIFYYENNRRVLQVFDCAMARYCYTLLLKEGSLSLNFNFVVNNNHANRDVIVDHYKTQSIAMEVEDNQVAYRSADVSLLEQAGREETPHALDSDEAQEQEVQESDERRRHHSNRSSFLAFIKRRTAATARL